MKKIIEGLCAVLGAFTFAYLTLMLIKYLFADFSGILCLMIVPFALGVLICIIGLMENLGQDKKIAGMFADRKEASHE